jgi:thiamine-phosphate pyrophosphorylase
MPPAPSTGVGARRRERLARSRLYVVTDARRARGDLEEFLESILGAGADIVQLREKDAEGGDLLRWGTVFREAASRHGALFVINDRADVAVAVDADGVHVGQGDLTPDITRRLVGPDMIIGLSTHTEDELYRASRHADYVSVGPVHATPTKPGRPAAGVALVRQAARGETRPWFAIGGINAETLGQVIRAGARRTVVVRAVTEAPDPAVVVRELLAGLPG